MPLRPRDWSRPSTRTRLDRENEENTTSEEERIITRKSTNAHPNSNIVGFFFVLNMCSCAACWLFDSCRIGLPLSSFSLFLDCCFCFFFGAPCAFCRGPFSWFSTGRHHSTAREGKKSRARNRFIFAGVKPFHKQRVCFRKRSFFRLSQIATLHSCRVASPERATLLPRVLLLFSGERLSVLRPFTGGVRCFHHSVLEANGHSPPRLETQTATHTDERDGAALREGQTRRSEQAGKSTDGRKETQTQKKK